jgi:hypothetical protein
MPAQRIMKWVKGVFKPFHGAQRNALGVLVAGLLECRQVGVCRIGRHLPSQALPKHCIKRVYRFLRNERIHLTKAFPLLASLAAGRRRKVLISVDWTAVRNFWVLVAGIVAKGRSLPIAWKAVDPLAYETSQNDVEEEFFLLLKKILPRRLRPVFLGDRGFKRGNLLAFLDGLDMKHIIRTTKDITVRAHSFRGKLRNLPLRRGEVRNLGWVQLRKDDPITCRLVVVWKEGQEEPWYLCTNLRLSSKKIVAAYAKRFTIEETFRDHKSHRFGWSLSDVKLSAPERLERVILVVVTAYLLVYLMGQMGERRGWQRALQANTRKRRENSLFQLGQWVLRNRPPTLSALRRTRIVAVYWADLRPEDR